MIKRREFIAGLGSTAAWPVVARAQQRALPVIGYLHLQSADDDHNSYIVPFLQGLKETGYVEARTWRSSIGMREIRLIGCQRLQPISSAAA
jgi:hypothetical protein